MFERFTERARQAVVLAQDEARNLKHNYIGSEHLLLGMIREEEGIAATILEDLGFEYDLVRGRVIEIVGLGSESVVGQVPWSPRLKKICELALREALSLGHNYIGTEHLLLGLVREGSGTAWRILGDAGLDADEIRNEVNRILMRETKKSVAKADKKVGKQTVATTTTGTAAGTVYSFTSTVASREQNLNRMIDLFKWFREKGFAPVTLTSYGLSGMLRINLDADHVWKHEQIAEISERVSEAGGQIEFSRKHGMTIREKQPIVVTGGPTAYTSASNTTT